MKKITVLIFVLHSTLNIIGETPVKKTIAKYDAAELLLKVFTTNQTVVPRRGYALIEPDNQYLQQNLVNFEQNHHFDNIPELNSHVNFENDLNDLNYGVPVENIVNSIPEGSPNKKTRRRRKPRQYFNGLQNLGTFSPGGDYGHRQPYQFFGGQNYKPPRPRPSLASQALTAVTGALTSIALYDDYQCVPRLLCEAAAGGTLGSSGIMQTVSGLQPLLTMLSAYGSISSNPLFVFGRAVFLGISSNGNPASCRYAYSLCPTDPEQLVHYLNNHNGGFFRFFNAPHQGQQNVEQFYNHLTQNYDAYLGDQDFTLQNYGLYQQNQNGNQQNFGFYKPSAQENYNFQRPGYQQQYGLAFPYRDYDHNIRYKTNDHLNYITNKIQKRIQNKPNIRYIDDVTDQNPSWTFPDASVDKPLKYVNNDVYNLLNEGTDNYIQVNYNKRYENAFKFPSNNYDQDNSLDNFKRRIRGFSFPESQSDKQNIDYNYHLYNSVLPKQYEYTENQYIRENKHLNNLNTNKYNYNDNENLQGVRTIYVVRGNGDPYKPEIIKLRPGETIQ